MVRSAKRDLGRRCRDRGKRAGNFPISTLRPAYLDEKCWNAHAKKIADQKYAASWIQHGWFNSLFDNFIAEEETFSLGFDHDWTSNDSLLECKSRMSYKSIDFDADRPIQYKEMRLSMTKIYMETDFSLFGPICVVPLPSDFDELTKAKQETV